VYRCIEDASVTDFRSVLDSHACIVHLTNHPILHCSIACDVQILHLVVIHRNVTSSFLVTSPSEMVGDVMDSLQEGKAKNRGLCASESLNVEPRYQ